MSNLDSKNNKGISVVIATYNGADYIIEQIGSILKQTLLPNEIIVVDDTSSDSTLTLIESLEIEDNFDIKLKIIKQKKNQGYIKNFLDGIFNTMCEYIFLCDQDDVWLPNKLADMVCLFEKHPEILALHSNTSIIDGNGEILQERVQNYYKELENMTLQKLIKKVNYPGMALAFRRTAIISKLKELAQSKVNIPTHDWTICFLACLQNGFYVTQHVYTYRRYTGKNVALSLDTNKKNYSITSRINGIKLYLVYYCFMREYQNVLGQQLPINVNQNILIAEKRIAYLKNKSLKKWLFSSLYINYYPSKKSYLMDLLVTLKDK